MSTWLSRAARDALATTALSGGEDEGRVEERITPVSTWLSRAARDAPATTMEGAATTTRQPEDSASEPTPTPYDEQENKMKRQMVGE